MLGAVLRSAACVYDIETPYVSLDYSFTSTHAFRPTQGRP